MTIRVWTDPIVDEIHEIREEIAKEANYDSHTLVSRLQASQQRHGDKLVRLSPQRVKQED